MADDDALIAKAAEALRSTLPLSSDGTGHIDCEYDEETKPDCGCIDVLPRSARAVIAAVRDQIAAEALLEAADEIHREARWQTEQQMRNAGTPSASQNYYVTCRLAVVESVLRARAYRLDPREAP